VDNADGTPELFPRQAALSDSSSRGTGILPYQQIVAMVKSREIDAIPEIDNSQIQPASIDLRLGRYAYRVRASFLPGAETSVMHRVQQMDGMPPIDLTPDGAVLEKGCVYVVEILESIKLPGGLTGFANPKSSTGRLDVLTRLITDRSVAFDKIEKGYLGPLYIEVAPQTFSVIVRRGSRLNQLRFERGSSAVSPGELRHLYETGQLVNAEYDLLPIQNNLIPVTVDLRGFGPGSTIGYRAKKHTDKIDIGRTGYYDPCEFWDEIKYHKNEVIILDPDEFYILATREEIGVPARLAAEMVAYNASSGEYRVHYAGFFDPGFGWTAGRAGGSKAVLEVRSHVPFMLEHGQPVGWLRYVRMTDTPDRAYGAALRSSYQNQGLTLAKHFWPTGDTSA
jgi:dCTP deaminase